MGDVPPVELKEYETSDPVRLDATDLAVLQTLPGRRLQVRPTGMPGWFTLHASSWVGSVILPTTRIRIRPKVEDLRNVLMMFGSVSRPADWSPESADYAEDDLAEGIAELVLRSVEEATRRGLLHGYETREERLPVVRGRIQVHEIAARPWDAWPVPCRYDDFTADIAENRVLLAAVELIRRWAVVPQVRSLATDLTERLAGVSTSAMPLLEVDLIRATPLNAHYQPALDLARVVLEGYGVAHAAGGQVGHAFLVDMNKLYERWIGAELVDRLWPELTVAEQEDVALSRGPDVWMAPDLVFRRAKSPVAVGDVKYKLTGSGLARGEDYYQLLAYLTAMELKRGVLVYCRYDERPPKEITVLGGQQQIICHALDLSGDWAAVSGRVDHLAHTVRGLSHE